MVRGSSDDDPIIGRIFLPPIVAVPRFDRNVLITKELHTLLGTLAEFFDNLDSVDMIDQFGQDGGLMP